MQKLHSVSNRVNKQETKCCDQHTSTFYSARRQQFKGIQMTLRNEHDLQKRKYVWETAAKHQKTKQNTNDFSLHKYGLGDWKCKSLVMYCCWVFTTKAYEARDSKHSGRISVPFWYEWAFITLWHGSRKLTFVMHFSVKSTFSLGDKLW